MSYLSENPTALDKYYDTELERRGHSIEDVDNPREKFEQLYPKEARKMSRVAEQEYGGDMVDAVMSMYDPLR